MLKSSILTQTTFSSWYKLRQQLETVEDPLILVAKFFHRLPRTKWYTDPYDQTNWPTPWELIEENEYCEFNLILGMCYTLQLTERFKKSKPLINVAIDTINKTVYYLLLIEDKVYGYVEEEWVGATTLPKTLKMQKIYSMSPLH